MHHSNLVIYPTHNSQGGHRWFCRFWWFLNHPSPRVKYDQHGVFSFLPRHSFAGVLAQGDFIVIIRVAVVVNPGSSMMYMMAYVQCRGTRRPKRL